MRWRPLAVLLILSIALTACAHQPPPTSGAPLPGFMIGLAHGYISLLSLIASLFAEVRIYEYPNAGFFYDFGYVIGVAAFFGGGGKTYTYVRRPR
ncbi:MAG TPA: hypothetical protein VMI56_08670 [Reyranella sp.]|nr:hypothetical protein [Reyranella sp.]